MATLQAIRFFSEFRHFLTAHFSAEAYCDLAHFRPKIVCDIDHIYTTKHPAKKVT
jgi:hypothetical protein